jgi:hypothetical protein
MRSSSPHACHMPCQSSPPWLGHSNNIWLRVQIMKLLLMQLFPASYYFIPFYWSRIFKWRNTKSVLIWIKFNVAELSLWRECSRTGSFSSHVLLYVRHMQDDIAVTVSWDVMSCSPAVHQRFGGRYCVRLQDLRVIQTSCQKKKAGGN